MRQCQYCWLTGFRVQVGKKTKLIFQTSPNLGWCKTGVQESKGKLWTAARQGREDNPVPTERGSPALCHVQPFRAPKTTFLSLLSPQHPERWRDTYLSPNPTPPLDPTASAISSYWAGPLLKPSYLTSVQVAVFESTLKFQHSHISSCDKPCTGSMSPTGWHNLLSWEGSSLTTR